MDLSEDTVLTVDDLPPINKITGFLRPSDTRWFLVDHNKLRGDLSSAYPECLSGAIDHHDDEHETLHVTDPEPRIIEKCGSCTSLVVQTLRSPWDELSDQSSTTDDGFTPKDSQSASPAVWNAQVAKLALASILIDTVNLTAKSKVEPTDVEAVGYLEAKIQQAPAAQSWNRDAFYKEINDAKTKIDDLDPIDILRKDYKQWTENNIVLGISSVVKPLDFLVEKGKSIQSKNSNAPQEAFEQLISEFMAQRRLSIFAIMTASTAPRGEFQRELFLQAQPEASEAAQRFAETATSDLGLESLGVEGLTGKGGSGKGTDDDGTDDDGTWRMVWLQKDVSKSRKQVAPLLRKAC